MRSRSPKVMRAALCLVFVAAVACDRESAPEAGAAAGDTSASDGLSSEQLQSQVLPMSPEQAKELGIIDSVAQGAQPSPASPSAIVPPTAPPGAGADTTP